MSFSNEDPPIHNPRCKHCCDCNGTHARCTRCVCARLGNPCTNCSPIAHGRCNNRHNQQHSFSQSTPLQQPYQSLLQQLQPHAQPLHSHQLLKLSLETNASPDSNTIIDQETTNKSDNDNKTTCCH